MDSNNFSFYPIFDSWLKGMRGNKRKNFRDRKKFGEPVNLSPPSGKLFYMDW